MNVLKVGNGWIAIDKPSGLPSHATDQNEDDALTLMKRELSKNTNLAKETGWDGFVSCAHRLDRETSGVLLITVKKSEATRLQNAFSPEQTTNQKSARKFYRAILRGKLAVDSGKWNFPISDKSEGRMNPQGKSPDRKASETLFEVTRRSDYLTEIKIDLRTGRQHQIRKHAALARHAVVGDQRYGEKKHSEMILKRYGSNRLLLHAEFLEIDLGDQKIEVSAPLPVEFEKVFEVSQ